MAEASADFAGSSERLFGLVLNIFTDDLEREVAFELCRLQELLQAHLNSGYHSSLQLRPAENLRDLLQTVDGLKVVDGFSQVVAHFVDLKGGDAVQQLLHLNKPSDVTKFCLLAAALDQLPRTSECLNDEDLHEFLRDECEEDEAEFGDAYRLLRFLVQNSVDWFEKLVLGLVSVEFEDVVDLLAPGQDLCSQKIQGENLSHWLAEKREASGYTKAKEVVWRGLNTVVQQHLVKFDLKTMKLVKERSQTAQLEQSLSPTAKKMMEHQRELAASALQGKNSIVVAPTGSGKTLVAVRVVQSVVEKSRDAKVVFLVPTGHLVEQQHKEIVTNLPERLKSRVCFIHGACDPQQRLPFTEALANNSVLVLTAQILLNQLNKKTVNIKDFHLLVFDECHNCKDKHAYNGIMEFYLEAKLRDRQQRLPQILGLTASPGTGKAQTIETAVQHLERLCSNLDCPVLSDVREHKASLEAVIADPQVNHHLVRRKGCDDFSRIIHEIMDEGEHLVEAAYQRMQSPEASPAPELQPRGSLSYVNYCSDIYYSMNDHGDETSKEMYACSTYLKHCNYALMMRQLFKSKDSLRYLLENLRSPDEMERLPTCDGERRLRDLLSQRIPELQRASDSAGTESPALLKLGNILTEHFADKNQSRAIVFVKEKFFARVLVDFINDKVPDPCGRSPWAAVVTGATASDREGGTRAAQQKARLQEFRAGKLGVLVCTSVTEEGLDIPACNLVIRYGHVTNEIAMVQARGRGRDKNSEYHVIMPEIDEKMLEKEKTNEARHKMMLAAIDELAKTPAQDLQDKILQLQRLRLQASEMERQPADRPAESVECDFLCKHCRTPLTTSNRMRLIQKIHRVALDANFFRTKVNGSKSDAKKINNQFEQVGIDLICRKCGTQVGKVVRFCHRFYPLVTVTGVLPKKRGSSEPERPLKKWKDAPYLGIRDISHEDKMRWTREVPGLPNNLQESQNN